MPYAILPEHVIAVWSKLSPKAKAVVVAVASHMDGSRKCWPGNKRVQELAGLKDRRSAWRAMIELESKGVFHIDKQRGKLSVISWPPDTQLPARNARASNAELPASGARARKKSTKGKDTKGGRKQPPTDMQVLGNLYEAEWERRFRTEPTGVYPWPRAGPTG